MWMELAHSFQQGDGFVYFMLGLAFIGVVVMFERLFMLQFVFNINLSKFLTNLKKAVKAEDFDRAMTLCKAAGKTSLPLISMRALEAAESDPSSVRGVIEEEALSFLPRLETRIGVLPLLAALTLLSGILGTINALWSAFHSVDVLDTAQKQAMIGHGIANSLSYSALGLMVAMLLLISHHLLRGMALSLVDKLHYGVTVLNNLLVPSEMAYVSMPAAAPQSFESTPMPVAISEPTQPVAQAAAAAPAAKEEDANFEEASVEDIKDEEEII